MLPSTGPTSPETRNASCPQEPLRDAEAFLATAGTSATGSNTDDALRPSQAQHGRIHAIDPTARLSARFIGRPVA